MELNRSWHARVVQRMRINRRRLIGAGLLSAVCLAGCQPHSATRNPASSYYIVPVGTTVTLHERLDIGPRRARVFLQDGTVVSSIGLGSGFSEYAPHCHFSVNEVLEVAQVIEPDTFTVTRVRMLDFQQVVDGLPEGRTLVAMLGGGFGDDGPDDVFHARQYDLDSPRQSQVRALTCAGALDDPVDAVPPSLVDIRQALGAFASLSVSPAGTW